MDGIELNLTNNVTIEESKKPEAWQTWGIGLLVITICSFAPSIAILFLSFISKTTFNRILTFLIALGVGALSGSALFILLPAAFHVSEMPDQDYVYKAWMALGGIYMLFVIDKIIKFIFEIRRMQKTKRKIHMEQVIDQIVIDANGSIDKKDSVAAASISDIPLPLQLEEAVDLSKDELSSVEEKKSDNGEPEEIKSVAFMILLGAWINNFVDGMSTGTAFADNFIRGVSLGVAVISEQFPQELAQLAIVITSGLGLKKALLLNLIQAALSYGGFVLGVLLNNAGGEARYDDIIFAISAGMYLYICLGVLVPEMSEKVLHTMQENRKEGLLTTVLQLLGISIGLVFIFLMALYGGDIEF